MSVSKKLFGYLSGRPHTTELKKKGSETYKYHHHPYYTLRSIGVKHWDETASKDKPKEHLQLVHGGNYNGWLQTQNRHLF